MSWSNPSRAEVLQVARDTGETVVEAWSDWDKGNMGTVVGPMLHHTGSSWSWPKLQAPTLKVVREGRSDLQNSLCMYYIDYKGIIYCINNKLSWHAGGGSWRSVTDGNGHFAGIEAESNGVSWTAETRESYVKLSAMILRKCGNNRDWAPRHLDYALPKGRKNDFSGMDAEKFWQDMEAFRVYGVGGLSVADAQSIQDVVNDCQAMLRRVAAELLGPSWYKEDYGWPTFRWNNNQDGKLKMTLVDYLRNIDKELNSFITISGRPAWGGADQQGQDTNLGWSVTAAAAAKKLLEAPAPTVDVSKIDWSKANITINQVISEQDKKDIAKLVLDGLAARMVN